MMPTTCTGTRSNLLLILQTRTHTQESQRGYRGETPGALTYSERLARRWLRGAQYGAYDLGDRFLRATSLEPGISSEFLVEKERETEQKNIVLHVLVEVQ